MTAGVVTTSYDESETTPLFGVVVKPWDHVSFYYNYIEGLSKGDIAPATASNWPVRSISPSFRRQLLSNIRCNSSLSKTFAKTLRFTLPPVRLRPNAILMY